MRLKHFVTLRESNSLVKTLVTDRRANGFVERTIGRLKNAILTYAKEKNPVFLGKMLERALGVLLFSVNATAKLTTFQAHHGCEAISVLRNLTTKPSLQHLN